jgi:hypothetical protein
VQVPAGQRSNGAIGLEVDLNNNDTDAAITNNAADQVHGVTVVSGGTNKPASGIRLTASQAGGRFQEGLLVFNWATRGIRIAQDAAAPAVTGACLYLVPSSNGANPMIQLRNAADLADVWRVNQDGTTVLANNIRLRFVDTLGGARDAFYAGADDTHHILAGRSNNGTLEDNAGAVVAQWNSGVGGGFKIVGNVGFYNTVAIAKQNVAGAKGGNAALGSLMAALSALGLVTDSTTA